ncbi:phosphate/phosphite/phosphonate ABC transporter substrate-binding protein [Paenibacillus athensensis]|uniref:Phosphonate-binding protein n=1 Tax=Paenibacillus athensensis TaxID=1967502 RepID=A0A4Y8PXR9_9BACL|nr:phosphate/phosphite/phosphonate ABC transporter substrate-binding protein [Paenibacillus athensensis]MCD1259339.1 phosphate/phosphite/phosphonate ABC transporter substrate-binding protein [Paenibacillus athensensis]
MLNKLTAIGLTLILGAGLAAAGCAKKEAAEGGYAPKELKVQFVPSQNAETLEAKAKPLENLLKDKLGIPVKVSVSTNYNTIVEAMASKQVDVGFLPPTAYVQAKEKGAAEVILQAQRFGINPANGENTTDLVDFYRAMIVVKADSPLKELKDLKGKTIAWQDVTSSAGYVWPAAEMKKAGVDPDKDVKGITVKGHDKGIMSVLDGDTDAAAVFEDARNTVKKDVPDVFSKVRVLYYTQPIPNDTISVRADMSKEWIAKLQNAFIDIAKSEEGRKIVQDVYSHQGYVVSDDTKFDIVREYGKAVGGK